MTGALVLYSYGLKSVLHLQIDCNFCNNTTIDFRRHKREKCIGKVRYCKLAAIL